MKLYKIYHNPRCSKSRQTLSLLQNAGINPEIILYLENKPSAKIISEILHKLQFDSARSLMRTGESLYKDLNLKNENDDAALIKAMSNHPKLIERPIVIKGDKAILGRPPENVLGLF